MPAALILEILLLLLTSTLLRVRHVLLVDLMWVHHHMVDLSWILDVPLVTATGQTCTMGTYCTIQRT